MLEPAYLGSTLCRFDHCVSCYLIINVPIRDATEGHRGGREALCDSVCVCVFSLSARRPPAHAQHCRVGFSYFRVASSSLLGQI